MGRPKKDGSPAVILKKQGRPRFQIDYDQLDAMCQMHCTEDECASIFNVDRDTLSAALKRDGNESFSAYFKKASAGGKMSLRRRQFKAAIEGSVPMMIWLGKNWLGQRDSFDSDDNDTSIAPVKVIVQAYDASKRNSSS